MPIFVWWLVSFSWLRVTLLGRAGRYGSDFPVGEVTCLHADDLPLLHSSLKSPSPILEVMYMNKLARDSFIPYVYDTCF